MCPINQFHKVCRPPWFSQPDQFTLLTLEIEAFARGNRFLLYVLCFPTICSLSNVSLESAQRCEMQFQVVCFKNGSPEKAIFGLQNSTHRVASTTFCSTQHGIRLKMDSRQSITSSKIAGFVGAYFESPCMGVKNPALSSCNQSEAATLAPSVLFCSRNGCEEREILGGFRAG